MYGHWRRRIVLCSVGFTFVFLILSHAAYAAPAIDGSAHGNTGGGLSVTATLTTTQSNDIIIVYASPNAGPVVSVSDTAGLTWQLRVDTQLNNSDIEEWYAIAASPLSSDVITVTQTGSNFMTIDAFGVSGPYKASPFAGPPVSSATDPVSVSTAFVNTMVIGGSRQATQITCTAGSGYSLISGAGYALAEYQTLSAAQSTLSVTLGSCAGDSNSMIGDIISSTPPPLSIDGTAHGNTNSGISTTATLTTAQPNDVIVAYVEANDGPVTSINDTAGLTWHHRTDTSGAGGGDLEEWYAIAASPLSSDVITVTQTGSNFMTIDAFGVSGANTFSPFDGTAVTGDGDPVSISTTHANDIIIGAAREYTQQTCTAGTDYTLLDGTDYAMAEYQMVSSAQSGLDVTQGSSCYGDANGTIGDAIQAAPTGGAPAGRIIRLTGGLRLLGGIRLE